MEWDVFVLIVGGVVYSLVIIFMVLLILIKVEEYKKARKGE